MSSHFLHGVASVSVDWGQKCLFWEQINPFHYQTAYFRKVLSIVERRALCYSNGLLQQPFYCSSSVLLQDLLLAGASSPGCKQMLVLCSHSSLEGKAFPGWV